MAANLAQAWHNLGMMLDAGVPLLRSLDTVGGGLNFRQKQAFHKLSDDISKGSTLAEAMSRSRRVFDPLDITLVESAEASGNLPQLLAMLSKWYEFTRRIKRKTIAAMILPISMIHAAAVFAPLPSIFLGGPSTRPYLHQVIGILLIFYVPAVTIFAVVRLTPKTGAARVMLDYMAYMVPILGKALYKLALTRYCRVFHMLFKAGVPVTTCAEKAASATSYAVVTKRVEATVEAAKAGGQLSEGFSPNLPGEFLNIWQVGEETGKLDDITNRMGEHYGEDAELLFTEFGSWFARAVYALVMIVMAYHVMKNFQLVYRSIL